MIRRLFIYICIYRLVNAYIIRTQFDPDEYWQTLEPAYCLVFGSPSNEEEINIDNDNIYDDNKIMNRYGCALTWEWTRRWTPDDDHSTSTSTTTDDSAIMQSTISTSIPNMIQQALHGPVRSYISILPTYWYYLACRALFNWAYYDDINHHEEEIDNDNNAASINNNIFTRNYKQVQTYIKQSIQQYSTYMISKGPVYLHAMLIVAPTDLCVWLIATRLNNLQYISSTATTTANHNIMQKSERWKSSWPTWALACSITSWFHGYALIRTYANSIETVCLLVGIALLGQELFDQSSSKHRHHYRLQAKLAFILGGLSACVRFTSLAAWIPIGLIISYRSGRLINTKQKYCYRIMLYTLFGLCGTYGLIGVILGCCIDRWFYGFWAIPFLGNIHFNVLLGQGSLYGTHPPLWYVYAGIPAICGVMLPFFLLEFTPITTSTLSTPRMTLLLIIVSYIILHSFSDHKEFRFLLPLLPLICILAGNTMSRLVCRDEKRNTKRLYISPKLMLLILILLSYPHLLYLGTIHQRGPVAVNQHLTSAIIDKESQKVSQSKTIQQYTVHYLMGCHSAPVYSHLHIPNARIKAWYLDCSPDCRSNPEIVCQSDAFLNDPLEFVKATYDLSPLDDSCTEDGSENGSCGEESAVKELPSFLVVMQDEAIAIETVLTEKLRMSHLASIRHSIKSLSWHSSSDAYEQCSPDESCHDAVTLFSWIDIHFDHMEVYAYELTYKL